jgi:hypothetical protein
MPGARTKVNLKTWQRALIKSFKGVWGAWLVWGPHIELLNWNTISSVPH